MSDSTNISSLSKPGFNSFSPDLTGLHAFAPPKAPEASALATTPASTDATSTPWSGDAHPLAPIAKSSSDVPVMAAAAAPASAEQAKMAEILPPMTIASSGDGGDSAPAMPAPIQQAFEQGTPVQFSSADENAAAGRQPDYFLNTDGTMVPNPKATPSADGSINVQIQSQDPQGNKSLRDAITRETENQKAAAQEMIRLFQKAHPGQPTPSWMTDLANARPNLPDFVPFKPAPNEAPAPAPENGFVNRGVHGGSNGGGTGSFAGNGGFDGGGNFRGNGGSGDGMINTGRSDRPLEPGEQVQAKQLFDYFKDHGFTDAQASGILGNIQTESSFRTDAHNKQEGAIGFCQWEGQRRVDLENFAAAEHKSPTDWHVQADFVMHELNGKEHVAMSYLKAAQTPGEAAYAFQHHYERSASLGDRAVHANHIYAQLHNTPSEAAKA